MDGLAVWAKRLEAGAFAPPAVAADAAGVGVGATDLAPILGGVDLRSARRRERHRRPVPV